MITGHVTEFRLEKSRSRVYVYAIRLCMTLWQYLSLIMASPKIEFPSLPINFRQTHIYSDFYIVRLPALEASKNEVSSLQRSKPQTPG